MHLFSLLDRMRRERGRGERDAETERQTGRYRDSDRETGRDRQIEETGEEREKGGDRDRQTERQTGRYRDSDRETGRDRQIDRGDRGKREKMVGTETDRQADTEIVIERQGETDR